MRAMDVERYFTDLGNELESLKDRVRHYIDDAHWLSDGEWKESVIRTILRRHLPSSVGVGRGFAINVNEPSTQIDVLLYDRSKPVLFQDGDFVIVTTDSVRGAIEVKTKLRRKKDLRSAINGLSAISRFINPMNTRKENQFFGLFCYEEPEFRTRHTLGILQECVDGQYGRIVNCLSLGKDYFVRFWQPTSPHVNMWHAYSIKNMARAYFIHNVIDHLCPEWTKQNENIWYPEERKEGHKIDEIPLYLPHQVREPII
jgi:hypothetical protein